MPVPTNGWINGGWNKNNKLSQFRLLAQMLGLSQPSISADELQVLFRKVASAKVFAESIQPFLAEAGHDPKWVVNQLVSIEQKLGLMEPLPMMSFNQGIVNPSSFSGVAIWPAGITNWTKLRLEQIELAERAGARFETILVFGSSRVCKAPADRRHPLIYGRPEGTEPTERQLQFELMYGLNDGGEVLGERYVEVELPELNADDRPLSLQQQLSHFVDSGQFDQYVGDRKVYVPSTPNSLYVPLHVRRVLGLDDVHFSQAGARVVREEMPDYWWPSLQDVRTTPNGIIRLWVELLHAGCITEGK